ncbi:MAG TPA: GtrA family protein [Blastocatellia bacterium]|nr:GtrA family protein [Blastocatellia bacterium]
MVDYLVTVATGRLADGKGSCPAGVSHKRQLRLKKASALLCRWVKFSMVGATGIAVQTLTLALLLRLSGLHYLAATAIAVEMSVLNNFVWHRRWTWADRQQVNTGSLLLHFNLTAGAMCLAGNLILMSALVGLVGMPPFAANLVTIAICSLANFTLSDRLVFL